MSPKPRTREIPTETLHRLHRRFRGDPEREEQILRFIEDRYGARTLCFLPMNVAEQALRRPEDFWKAAQRHCQPELGI